MYDEYINASKWYVPAKGKGKHRDAKGHDSLSEVHHAMTIESQAVAHKAILVQSHHPSTTRPGRCAICGSTKRCQHRLSLLVQ